MNFSVAVFLFVVLFSFGFIVQTTRRFSFWKFAIMLFLVLSFLYHYGFSEGYIWLMVGSFCFGFLLPYASALSGVGEALSDLINSIRYRDAYEDIKRKEEEVEELRRQYEQARANAQANRDNQEEARKKRQEESEQFRQRYKFYGGNKKSSDETSSDSSSSGRSRSSSGSRSSSDSSSQQQSYTRSESARERYLKILGLDPNGSYTFAEIKRAYRKKAFEFHPDRHSGKSEEFLREMGEKFKQVKDAFEGLVREL